MNTKHTSSKHIAVATANTHFGQMVRTKGGLDRVAQADVILFQEVFNTEADSLIISLKKTNFTLLYCAPQFGLAIALRNNSAFHYVPGSVQKHTLAKLGKIEQMVIEKATSQPLVFNARGVISCTLVDDQGKYITVATTHPTTPLSAKPWARNVQIIKLKKLLLEKYANDHLVLGGDMNHYPGPRKIDTSLHLSTNLTPVDLGKTPTWYARGSKEEFLFKLPSFLLRRSVDTFNGQHDIILYRRPFLQVSSVEVVDIPSDHRAIIANFTVC